MRPEAKEIYKNLKLPPVTTKLSLLDIAESEMDRIVWIPILDDLSQEKMAFVTKTPSGAYKLFVNTKIPSNYHDFFKLH